MATQRFSPREFLRARRPERFSDSVVEEGAVLDRSMLEYHLDTLTSRSQENDFQVFARHLAEREICSNLLPQTGPTGGGDSKVDTETYPVADNLSLVWYVGAGREAASERWGFAFSTKKDWRPKVISDIAKIAETGRGYSKGIFITNQYVPDRVRAKLEDELSKKHSLGVRILDRSWILDRVFTGRHEALAMKDLELTTSVRTQVRKGPHDLKREQEMEQVEERIRTASQEQSFGIQFAKDCTEAAILARSLNRPRTEVDGKFVRAERVAKEHGTSHQYLVSVYQRAWTSFWWYEDYKMFVELYRATEKLVLGSRNAYELELMSNLWYILNSLVRSGDLGREDVNLEARTKVLTVELERLSDERDRPSTSLQARTLRLLVQLAASFPSDVDSVLRDLQEVIRQCQGLVGYPLESLVEILMELGSFIGDRPVYVELFETIIEITSARKGEVVAARMLLRRGSQELENDRPYEAIRVLGQSLGRLHKHESRHDAVHALYECGNAYERIGLLWAARGTLVTAASIATNEFWSHTDVTYMQAVCYRRLKWLELQLGRVPHSLAWHELHSAVMHVLTDQGYNAESLGRGEMEFDAILGILLLRADLWQLGRMTGMPDSLDRLGLQNAAIALRYALGYENELPNDLLTGAVESQIGYEFFARWRDQPAGENLPLVPLLGERRTLTLSSNVLGCYISVESENCSPCVELAESMLAALESLLSTGFVDGLLAREPVLTIRIGKSDFVEKPFVFEMNDQGGRPHVQLRSGFFSPHAMSVDAQAEIKDKLFDLLVKILARVFFIVDPEQVTTKLFRDERALERSIHFTSSFVAVGNVLGRTPRTQLSAWSEMAGVRSYPLIRSEVWDAVERAAKTERAQPVDRSSTTFSEGEPPVNLRNTESAKHTQMQTVSLIRELLWDEAKWSGTAFFLFPDNSRPPFLALLFKHAEPARQIFSFWQIEIGSNDVDRRLWVTIVRGISKKHPHYYRVVIGANAEGVFSNPDIKYAAMIFRINTMEPSSDRNLKGFLDNYKTCGKYFLAHAVLHNPSFEPVLVQESAIGKSELHVREAWQIGKHDVDSVGILVDDDPIIPEGHQQDAPVLDLLRWRGERTKGK